MGSTGNGAQTILVTGGSGFIGSNFIRFVLAERADVRVVNMDALTYAADPRNLADVQDDARYVFVRADVRDASAIDGVFARFSPDAVVHFAAESHVDRSIAAPGLFQETNVGGTVAVLEAARRCWSSADGVREGHVFVHVSTDEVYGDLPLEEDVSDAACALGCASGLPSGRGASPRAAALPDEADEAFAAACCGTKTRTSAADAFVEDSPLLPRSPYAASKAAAEMFVRSYRQTYGLPAVIVRCSNNYGPRQHEEKLIPKTIACACAGVPVPLYGSGLNVRDWLYVKDCCRGVLAALEKGRPGQAYNLGGGCALPNVRLIEAVRSALSEAGFDRAAAFSVERVADRKGHDRRYAMNCEKAAAELGWRPTMSFEEGMRATVAWYLKRAGIA